jgi:DNA-binding IclR family transcriptional regulator
MSSRSSRTSDAGDARSEKAGALVLGPAHRTLGEARGEMRLNAMGKAFSILEIVAMARRPLPMAEIVRATGLTKPTAHRITALLTAMGFIERDPARNGFIEGPRLIGLALDTMTAAAPRGLRHAVLRSVSEAVGETCNFGILAGAEVIYLDRVEAKWPLGLRFEAGSRVPAHCTANGKLLLAMLPEADRHAIVASMPLGRYTARTLTDQAGLHAALDIIAETRVGIDDQEFIDGVICVSVPVEAAGGRIIGGIAVSAPEARVGLKQALAFVPVMREAASRLAATFAIGPAGY